MRASKLANVLSPFADRHVVGLVRHSWWSPQEAVEKCEIKPYQVFSLTCGPLELKFNEKESLFLASDPAINGIVAWTQFSTADGKEKDDDFCVNASDAYASESRWAKLRNRKISFIEILKPKPSLMNPKQASLPSEVGVIIWFSYGRNLVASHGLHDGSDDFSVLDQRDLSNKIANQLSAIRITGDQIGRVRDLKASWPLK